MIVRPAPRFAPAVRLVALCLGLALIAPNATVAATLPTGFTEALVASGLVKPTAMAFAPDGRLFVTQQEGALRVIKNGALLTDPFVTLSVNFSGERGLLGVAFDPAFTSNGFVYVYYTTSTSPIHNRISRFTAAGDRALGAETILFDLETLSASNHNGGAIHFGPDGKLYAAVGENAVGSNSQSLANRLGKLLRINADGSIPADNPTAFSGITGTTSGLNKSIWAVGLRNPYTFAFQPGTGRMFINDVGEGTWEEIDDGIAGSNYGWNISEGPTTDPRFRTPLSYYGHNPECAITGGAFYNPATVQFPADYVGDYFFADFCGGWIKRFDVGTGAVTPFATGISSPVDLQVATDGSLYYLARGSGSVFRVAATAGQGPTIVTHPANQVVAAGQPATFSVVANGTPPLTYQWQRNNADIPGAQSSTYTIQSVTAADSGARFKVRVSNAFGNLFSNEATLTVTSSPPPGPAFVKTIANATLSRSGNSNLTFIVPAGGVGGGHTIVMAVSVGTFAGAVACRDSKGNVYSVDADIRGTGRIFVCSSRNVVGLVSGDTITATYPGFSGISAVTASEYSGVSTVGPSSTKAGNSNAPSVTVSATAGDLIVGGFTYGATPAFSPRCGFASAGEAAGGTGSGRKVVDAEWLVAATTKSYPVCGALSAPRPWLAAAVVYRP